MIKRFYYDLETTGTLPHKHGIHQIAGMVEIDGKIEEKFNFKVQPNPKALIDPEALKAGNVTAEQIMAYEPMGAGYTKVINLLSKYVDRYKKHDKFTLIGYNSVKFDDPMFRAFFKQNGDEYFGSWFWSAGICVMVLAAEVLEAERPSMVDFKLRTVAAKFGIPVIEDKLHDAEYDIDLTRSIHYKIKELTNVGTAVKPFLGETIKGNSLEA